MISFIIGVVGALIALIGWFAFDSILLLIIGTLFYVIESLMEWRELNANAKIFDVVIFGVGCIFALFVSTPFYIGGMVAINCYSALMCLLGIPSFISQLKFFFEIFRR